MQSQYNYQSRFLHPLPSNRQHPLLSLLKQTKEKTQHENQYQQQNQWQSTPRYQSQILNRKNDNKQSQKLSNFIYNPSKIAGIEYSTNNILIDQTRRIIYLPAYMQLTFNNISNISIEKLSAKLHISLNLQIFCGGLISLQDQRLKNYKHRMLEKQILHRLKNQIIINFTRDEPIQLSSHNNTHNQSQAEQQCFKQIEYDQKKGLMKYSINRQFNWYLQSDVFLSPFQVINPVFLVTIHPIIFSLSKVFDAEQSWKICFNLIDHRSNNFKISLSNWKKFGNYHLAQNKIKAFYSNYKIQGIYWFDIKPLERNQIRESIQTEFRQEQRDKTDNTFLFSSQFLTIVQRYFSKCFANSTYTIEQMPSTSFQYAHYMIPFYKDPTSSLFTIFIPLWFLGIINLGIFYQDENLGDRMSCIAIVILAFIALIPTIRSQIPPVPQILLVEILMLLQICITLFALFDSVYVSDKVNYQLELGFNIQSLLFYLSLLLLLINVAAVILLWTWHKCYWLEDYTIVKQDYTIVKEDNIFINNQHRSNNRNNQNKNNSNNGCNLNLSKGKQSHLIKKKKLFKRKNWYNLECDLYFKKNFRMNRKNEEFFIRIDKKQKQNVKKEKGINKEQNNQLQKDTSSHKQSIRFFQRVFQSKR